MRMQMATTLAGSYTGIAPADLCNGLEIFCEDSRNRTAFVIEMWAM